MSLITEEKHNNFKHNSVSRFYILSAVAVMFFFMFAEVNSVSAKNFTIFNALNVNQPYFTVNGITGNIGVGTTTPSQKLSVEGSSARIRIDTLSGNSGGLEVQGSTAANNPYGRFLLEGLGATPYLNIQAGDGLAYRSLILNGAGGNVGIGTNAPGSKLHVIGKTQITDGIAGADTQSYGTFGVTREASTTALSYISMTRAGNVVKAMGIDSSNNWLFGVPTSGTQAITPWITINTSGNVGIGTTAPLDEFSIGNAGGTAAPVGSANTGHNYTSTYLSTDDYALTNYGIVKTLIGNATSSLVAGSLWSGTLNGNIWNGAAGVGNVGIGTTSPATSLDVVSTNANPLRIYRNSGNSSLQVQNDIISAYFGLNGSDNIALGFALDQTNAPFQINPAGNVGIGTTTPGQKLDVSGGSIRTTNQLISTVAAGTAPLAVTSKTLVNNLNADLLDGYSYDGNQLYKNTASLVITRGASDRYVWVRLSADSHLPRKTYYITGAWNNQLSSMEVQIDNYDFNSAANIDIKATRQNSFCFDEVRLTAGSTAYYRDVWLKIFIPYFDGNYGTTGTLTVSSNETLDTFTETATEPASTIIDTYAGLHVDNTQYVVTGVSKFGTLITSGNVGIGTAVPNDVFSIGNSGVAPVGSSKTGHNFTSTYLSTDDYALANYGLVRTLIGNATSSLVAGSLWSGTLNGNIWNGASGTGNVGIGTTTPMAKLEVYNNAAYYATTLAAVNNSSIAFRIKSRGTWNTTLGIGAIGDVDKIGFQAFDSVLNTAKDILLNPFGGNVGIGTTTPLFPLDIVSPSISAMRLYKNNAGADSATALLTLEQGGAGDVGLDFLMTGSQRWRMGIDNSDADKFKISSAASFTAGTKFTMDINGNVGINTTTPLNKLQIGQTGYTGNDFVVGNANGSVAINNNSGNSYIFGSQRLDLLASGSGISILTGGNVGIGTSTPGTNKLYVNGNTYLNGTATINGIATVNSGLELATGGTRSVSYYGPLANGYFTQMMQTATGGFGTYGDVTSDWAMYNRFSGANTRGWVWQLGTVNVASLNGQGNMQLAGNLTSLGTVNAQAFTSSNFTNTKNRILYTTAGGTITPSTVLTNPNDTEININGGIVYKRTPIANADYTATSTDYIIAYTSLTANRVLTLPTALCASGRALLIVNEASSTFNVVITPASGKISGSPTFSLQSYWSTPVYCNGTDWFIY